MATRRTCAIPRCTTHPVRLADGVPCEEHGLVFAMALNMVLRIGPSQYAIHCAALCALATLEAAAKTHVSRFAVNDVLKELAHNVGIRLIDLLGFAAEIATDPGDHANDGPNDATDDVDRWAAGRGQW